jgi:hypothetical protein
MVTPLGGLSAHFNPATLQVSVNIGLSISHEALDPQIRDSLLPVTPLRQRRFGDAGQLGYALGTEQLSAFHTSLYSRVVGGRDCCPAIPFQADSAILAKTCRENPGILSAWRC